MKTRFIHCAWALNLLLTFPVVAQSTFQLQNFNQSAGIDAPVFDAQGARLAGLNFAVELWGGATSDSLSPALDFRSGQRVILSFLTGANAGYFTSANEVAVWQVAGGSFAWVQVRAWDARLGSTYEEVSARGLGGYGESGLLYLMGGGHGALIPPAPLNGLQSFNLLPVVPEPSSLLLLLLGLPFLARYCRRIR